MIHIIKNEDYYYTLPMYPYSKRADINLAYKTITHLLPGFKAEQLKEKITEIFGVELSTPFLGHALKQFTERGYLENHPKRQRTWYQSRYHPTSLYVNSFADN